MKKKRLNLGVAAAAILAVSAITGCVTPYGSETASIGDWGIDLAQRDLAVDPGDDFNAYVNGVWLSNTEIPPDLARYGMFDQLRLDAEADIRAIVEELAAADAPDGSLEQKVGDFYASWMDVEKLDGMGAEPLKPYLEDIFAIDDKAGLMKAYASLHGDAPFGVGIIPDPADTTRYIAFVGQSGLGMPDRDYYLKDDDRFVQYRNAYDDYVTEVFTLAGLDNAEARADAVIALETELAALHWTQA
ncbi:MAG: M13 family peptidase, partial [Hyphococcus sp.]